MASRGQTGLCGAALAPGHYSCRFLCTLSSLPPPSILPPPSSALSFHHPALPPSSPPPSILQVAHVQPNGLRALKKAAVTSPPFHGSPPLLHWPRHRFFFIHIPSHVLPVPPSPMSSLSSSPQPSDHSRLWRRLVIAAAGAEGGMRKRSASRERGIPVETGGKETSISPFVFSADDDPDHRRESHQVCTFPPSPQSLFSVGFHPFSSSDSELSHV